VLKTRSWLVHAIDIDPVAFFRALPKHFSNVTSLYVEGTSIASEVEGCYRQHAEPGPYLPEVGTIWPASKKLRCLFSKKLCEALGLLAAHAAPPELGDHFHLYKDSESILCWHDAFAVDLWLSSRIPEEIARAFASTLGRTYEPAQEHS
jgi:hypothetical protein